MHGMLMCGTLALAGAAWAQTDSRPKFEVASVKPGVDCGSARGRHEWSPGRISIQCQTLMGLILTAYFEFAGAQVNPMVPMPEIEGEPSWAGSDPYTITAKAEGTPRRELMSGPMLQRLLEERFQMKVHFETRGQVAVSVLTVAKGGPKLTPFHEGSCVPIESSRTLPEPLPPGQKRCTGSALAGKEPNMTIADMEGVTLEQFAGFLTYPLFRTVVDKTGITGRYDFHLEFALDESSPRFVADGATGPSISTALQQFGLKLETAKQPKKVLIIDHAQKPSGN